MAEIWTQTRDREPISRVLLVGDPHGLPALLKEVPPALVVGLVGAALRPQQHAALAEIARAAGVPLLIQPRRAEAAFDDFVRQVEALRPDLILVYSYAMLLPEPILAIPRHGAVNVHIALLPQYRGANPIQYALLNGERETGVTMHYMDARFDGGPIIAQCRVPIAFEDTWVHLYDRLSAAAERLLAEELPKVLTHRHQWVIQDESQARHCRRRHPADGEIDWSDSVLRIYNLIRGLVRPHPGAFYLRGETRVVLDTYMTLPAVAALKYSRQGGGRRLAGSRVRLEPSKRALQDNRQLCFMVRSVTGGPPLGACRLMIDLRRHTSTAWIALKGDLLQDQVLAREINALLTRFVIEELELPAVRCVLVATGRPATTQT